MKSVFDFDSYQDYLKAALPVSGPQRGARARLAEALGCLPGFVSLVLSGNSEFSLEHAIRTSSFLRHDSEERDFFLLLVQHNRAGSKNLESYFQEKIATTLKRRREIKERIETRTSLTAEDQLIYYSSWHYTAIHMCLMVSHLRTRREIASALRISEESVAEGLRFLVRTGIALEKNGGFESGPTRIHLPAESPLVAKHHTSWRLQAIRSLDHRGAIDLHYSLVMSLSAEAAEQIRKILLNGIQEVEPVLRAAKDEKVFALNLDLFEMA